MEEWCKKWEKNWREKYQNYFLRYANATQFFSSHNYNAAIAKFKEAQKYIPHDYEVSFCLVEFGDSYLKLKQYNKALKKYRKAIEIEMNFKLKNERKSIHHYCTTLLTENHKKAIKYCQKILNNDPNNNVNSHIEMRIAFNRLKQYEEGDNKFEFDTNLEPYLKIANTHELMQNYEEVIEILKLLNKLYPQYENAYISLADTYYEIDQAEKSIKTLKKFIKLFPTSAKGYEELGNLFCALERNFEAMEQYKIALEIKKNPSLFNSIADIYYDERNKEEAIDHYKLALSFDEKNAYAIKSIGDILISTGNINEGIENYKKAIEIDPEFIDTYLEYGRILYAKLNRIDEAIELLNRALEFDETDAFVLNVFALLYIEMQKYEEAIEMVKRAENNPRKFFSYAHFIALGEQKKYEEAIVLIEQSLNVKSINHGLFLIYYSYYLIKLGKYEEAQRKVIKGLELESVYIFGYAVYGIVLYKMGCFEEAIVQLEKVILGRNDEWKYRGVCVKYKFCEFFYYYGLALKKMKRSKEEILEKLMQGKEDVAHFAKLNFRIGELYWESGQYEEAKQEFRQAIESNPLSPPIQQLSNPQLEKIIKIFM